MWPLNPPAGLKAERGAVGACGTIEHKSAWLSETAVLKPMSRAQKNTPSPLAGKPTFRHQDRTAGIRLPSPPRLKARWQRAGRRMASTPLLKSDAKRAADTFYALSMFPILGNCTWAMWRTMCHPIVDRPGPRLRGRQVLQADGLGDRLGLPAENARRSSEESIPGDWTDAKHRAQMRGPAQRLGLLSIGLGPGGGHLHADYSLDQWLFSVSHEAGLAYRKEARSTGSRIDQTVLATHEQVDRRGPLPGAPGQGGETAACANGFLRITDYAEASAR